MIPTAQLSNQELYELCRKYGLQARLWKRKFIGLLPEVNRRKLYEQQGFTSIFEFAAKLAGISAEQVDRVLAVGKKFEDKLVLKDLLESGEVSVHKLARIASVATPENQDFWAAQTKILSQSALETLVKDSKIFDQLTGQVDGAPFVRKHKQGEILQFSQDGEDGLRLSDEVKQKLLELQNKGVDVNQLLKEFFENRELEIAREKEGIAARIGEQSGRQTSRYIPIKIKKLIRAEYGTKCAIPACSKDSEVIHHTDRFSVSKTHNPYFLAPLCRDHHLIAHSIDVKFHEQRSAA